MEKDIFDIIERKEYRELSPEELVEVKELCDSEDAYNNLRSILAQTSNLSNPQPKAETKSKLDNLFAAQSFPKAAPIWYNSLWATIYPTDKKFVQRPLIQVAAVLLLFVAAIPLVNTSNQMETNQLAVIDKEEAPTMDNKLLNEETVNGQESKTKEIKLDEVTEAEDAEFNGQLNQTLYSLDSTSTIRNSYTWTVSESAAAAEPTPALAYRELDSEEELMGDGPVTESMADFTMDVKEDVIAHSDVSVASRSAMSNERKDKSNSISVSQKPKMLDLLATTF